jgi:hypothetical protein
MHTPSTRTLSALAYDREEDYDPADPSPQPARGPVAHGAGAADHRRGRPYDPAPPAPVQTSRTGRDPGVILGGGPDGRALGSDARSSRLMSRRPGPTPIHHYHLEGDHRSTTIFDDPGRREARRHAGVRRRQPDSPRLTGSDRARPVRRALGQRLCTDGMPSVEAAPCDRRQPGFRLSRLGRSHSPAY